MIPLLYEYKNAGIVSKNTILARFSFQIYKRRFFRMKSHIYSYSVTTPFCSITFAYRADSPVAMIA